MSADPASLNQVTQPTVVIQDGLHWWRYDDLQRTVTTRDAAEIPAALEQIEQAVEVGRLYAAGFLTYEAAAAYRLDTHSPTPDGLPMLWFGLFGRRDDIGRPTSTAPYVFGDWRPSLDYDTYQLAIGRIKEQIAAANTYQANFTFGLEASFSGDPQGLYAWLCRAQRAAYTAYIDLGRDVVCSASPELFFRLDGDRITSRPMKGTAARGLTAAADRANRAWLQRSEKNRAENVMIVDMIRNDIGRIAETGSVAVPDLFTVETYPTLLQMTSTVEARTQASLAEIMAAMFPCASITGAPKVSTMGILRGLEGGPRGLYTGAIGHLAPGRRAQFNVAIRTVVIDRQDGRATYGAGGGIIWDSDAHSEYEECLLKARVLQRDERLATPFYLIESLRWTPEDGYALLPEHLRRLGDSAAYFAFPYARATVLAKLFQAAARLAVASKVRLLLDEQGWVTVSAEPLAAGDAAQPVRLGLAAEPVNADNRWLYHKTTVRDMYEAARASRPDCDNVILWNERGELTESSAANLVLDVDGRLLTPPVSSGLLPGTLRSHLLNTGQIEEVVLRSDDLDRAGAIYLINSVRGWMTACHVGEGT